ncbi:hypothetical protein PILCRDRAFT_803103, partial [Piloderma croceum F 1598]
IQLALQGCLSILLIPDSDDDYVRPYHTSLLDFLNDPSRRKDQFFDLMKCQEIIVIGCIKLITSNSECNTRSLTYAYRNWCHHLHRVLSCGKVVGHIQSNLGQGVSVLVGKLLQNFKDWMVALKDHWDLDRVQDDLQSAINIMKEQWIPNKSLIQGVEQIISNIDVDCEFIRNFCLLLCNVVSLFTDWTVHFVSEDERIMADLMAYHALGDGLIVWLILFFNSLYVPGHTQISTNTDTVSAFGLSQGIPLLMLFLPLPSHSFIGSFAYAVSAFAFPQHWYSEVRIVACVEVCIAVMANFVADVTFRVKKEIY